MAKQNEQQIAKEIYEQIGGTRNVNTLINCMTRVRIDLKDPSLVNDESVKQINGVLGTVEEDTYQIILGPGLAAKVANEMGSIADLSVEEEGSPSEDQALFSKDTDHLDQLTAQNKAAQREKHNPQSPLKKILRSIASIFIPLIPAFVGAGIIGGIASIFTNLLTAGTISGVGFEYLVSIAGLIQGALFGFLNIYVGINAAKVFKATEGLGGIIGGIVYLTSISEELPLPNIFTGEPLTANQGGIIGVIFAVWILSLVEHWLRKFIPNSIDIIVTPTITLIVVGLATIFLIMPLAGFISTNLVGFISWILGVGGAIAGFVLGSLFLPMVMFGLHQILTPVHVTMIEQTGATQLLPILAMAGAGQVGAALALWVKARKNKQLVTMIKGALPVGILGIGEPLIYAVTLPLGRPFITACIGGGIGGAVIGLFGGVGASAIGPSGVALIPLIVDNLWWAYILGLLAAYAGGFIATYFFGVPKEALEPSSVSL
ncbi:PTS transporter subunit EIIC [Marinilactibacillus piezotolerans]|uniref:PTS transporter subunit EIIC n=1 Tax=Marinilactibacillus piezotolerans TaxID=258723 RepID=UPI0009B01FE5|nr:PTS transporter subunit EIIC [Marinilactibacillus piezotolerans]